MATARKATGRTVVRFPAGTWHEGPLKHTDEGKDLQDAYSDLRGLVQTTLPRTHTRLRGLANRNIGG